MATLLTTPAAVLPISLADAKTYLRVDHSSEDTMISELIEQATSFIETRSNRKLITQTWRVFTDEMPRNRLLEIPISPVQSVIEIRVFDQDGNSQILDSEEYEVDTHSQFPRIQFLNPQTAGVMLNGMEIDLTAGFGSSGADIPGAIRRALMVTIAHWYEFRGSVNPAEQPISEPAELNNLLAPFQTGRL